MPRQKIDMPASFQFAQYVVRPAFVLHVARRADFLEARCDLTFREGIADEIQHAKLAHGQAVFFHAGTSRCLKACRPFRFVWRSVVRSISPAEIIDAILRITRTELFQPR